MNPVLAESPEAIRARMLTRRRALSIKEVETLSAQACERWFETSAGKELLQRTQSTQHTKASALALGVYSAMPGELNPVAFDARMREIGARLFYPKVVDQSKGKLKFVEALSPPGDLSGWVSGPYGVNEPSEHSRNAQPSVLDLILVPAVALGQKGERLGHGSGYYDRFLSENPSALRVALAFDFQVEPSLPQAEWDQRMDWVVTPTREFRAKRPEN